MQFESAAFFEYYEAAHQHPINRAVHHFAHCLAVLGVGLLAFKPLLCLVMISAAFLFSWSGHYLFEKNTPAFFDKNDVDDTCESVAHSITVAVGGVAWTFVCFFRLFRQGPQASGSGRRALPLLGILIMLVAGYLVWQWTESLGGPAGLSQHFGAIAPLVSIPVHLILSATPFPSETIGIANGAIYGLWAGTFFGWVAWWGGSIVEYDIARRSIGTEKDAKNIRLPRWLQRVPASNPVFLILGRLFPFGYHAVNISAGIKHVSLLRHALCSAVANFIYAFAMAAAGAGLISV